MPCVAINRLDVVAASLRWDRGRWLWLLLAAAIMSTVLALGDNASELLRYDRGAIAAGGWWRLLTAHIVHLDAHHLILNLFGLILVWALFAEDFGPIEWLVIGLCAAIAISCGLWWLSPRVAWYVGASGLLHAMMAAGTARHVLDKVWDRWLLAAGLTIKVGYEQLAGHPSPLIVADAHLYGTLCGFAVGAALTGLRSRRGSL